MQNTGIGAVLLPFFLCLPCLPILLAGAGAAVLAAGAVAWIADDALIAVAGLAAAVIIGAAFLAYRRRCAAFCSIDLGVSRNPRSSALGGKTRAETAKG